MSEKKVYKGINRLDGWLLFLALGLSSVLVLLLSVSY
jgi:hypothetical protein